jgi:serine/threonine protein kinase
LEHENVLGIKRILKPKDPKNYNEIYVVSELMETDLAQIIKSNQPLTDDHTQFFLYQLLRGLKYIHSAGIYHRDLKPRNLLINSNCDLKICDFGLARADIASLQNESTALTDYIATRWYRAPEVILSWKKYTAAIDMWSVGCILAELIIRKPLLPAASEEEQLNMITKLLGNPSSKQVNQIENEKNREFVLQLPKREAKDFTQIFKGANPLAIDLLKKMLTYDPDERISVADALAHPYLKQLHFPDDEPTTEPVSAFDFDFEKFSLGKDDFKELIYEEIMLYHSDEAAFEYIKNKRKYPEGILHIKYGNRFRKAYKTDEAS